MKFRRLLAARIGFAALAAVLAVGCSQDKSSDPSSASSGDRGTEQDLLEEWNALETAEGPVVAKRFEVASRLALFGPQAFNVLYDIVADPETTDEQKVHVLQVMMTFAHPDHFERLKELSESEDPTAQAIAVHLIGYSRHPEALEFLQETSENSEGAVHFASLLGRVILEDPGAAEKFVGLYHEPETPDLQKEEIVRIILGQWNPREVDILLDAVVQPWLDSELRAVIADTMGQNGVVEALEPLQESIEVDSDPEYQTRAQAAIAALEEVEPSA